MLVMEVIERDLLSMVFRSLLATVCSSCVARILFLPLEGHHSLYFFQPTFSGNKIRDDDDKDMFWSKRGTKKETVPTGLASELGHRPDSRERRKSRIRQD